MSRMRSPSPTHSAVRSSDLWRPPEGHQGQRGPFAPAKRSKSAFRSSQRRISLRRCRETLGILGGFLKGIFPGNGHLLVVSTFSPPSRPRTGLERRADVEEASITLLEDLEDRGDGEAGRVCPADEAAVKVAVELKAPFKERGDDFLSPDTVPRSKDVGPVDFQGFLIDELPDLLP